MQTMYPYPVGAVVQFILMMDGQNRVFPLFHCPWQKLVRPSRSLAALRHLSKPEKTTMPRDTMRARRRAEDVERSGAAEQR